jgi:hypothetical protein
MFGNMCQVMTFQDDGSLSKRPFLRRIDKENKENSLSGISYPSRTLTSSSSREICAYCDTEFTVSSKFYNITCVGDVEHIGRRLNQLGPKKNMVERVCKRHYDINLKRDKTHKQTNEKRERLPGINFIFDVVSSKKQKIDHSNYRSTSHTVSTPTKVIPSSSKELQFCNPPNNWKQQMDNLNFQSTIHTVSKPTTSPQSSSKEMQFLPPDNRKYDYNFLTPDSYLLPNTENHHIRSEYLGKRKSVNPEISVPVKTFPWNWDTCRPEIHTPKIPDNQFIGKPILNTEDEVDEPTLELIIHHLIKLLDLFSNNSAENLSVLESIKETYKNSPIVVHALCNQTYSIISKIKLEEDKTLMEIRTTVQDLTNIKDFQMDDLLVQRLMNTDKYNKEKFKYK